MNRWRGAATLGAVTLLVVGISIPALAFSADPDNLTPTANYNHVYCQNQTLATASIVCQTDNGGVSVFMQSSVSAAMEPLIERALDNSFDPIPGISITYVSTPTYSGSAETDIIYQQGTLPSGVVGMYWCNDAVDSSQYRCDQGYVRFRASTTYERRSLACHETGHAFGLLHGANASPTTSNTSSKVGCMRTPFSESAYVLGANNAGQIEETY